MRREGLTGCGLGGGGKGSSTGPAASLPRRSPANDWPQRVDGPEQSKMHLDPQVAWQPGHMGSKRATALHRAPSTGTVTEQWLVS